MSTILNKLWGNLKSTHDDDIVDRANYVYTSLMFLSCALTIASKQYVGKPIQCWIPPHFKGSWESYAENYCFVENTYFVHMYEKFPEKQADRTDREIAYYQWVPLLLALQMLACWLPRIFFKAMNFSAGYSMEKLVQAVSSIKKDKEEYKFTDPTIEKASKYFGALHAGRAQKAQQAKDSASEIQRIKSIFYQNRDTTLYMLYKLLNLANSLGQVYVLNRLLWPDYDFWGYGFFQDLRNNREWKESGMFPRVTFCDIEIRDIGEQPLRHTLQCVLMINFFNEKIYVVIWFWLLALSFLNVCNLVYWFWCSYFSFNLINFISRHLAYNSHKNKPSPAEIERFAKNYLTMDGVTALRLLEFNTDVFATSEMINQLWKIFKKKEEKSTQKKTRHMDSSDEEDSDSGLYLHDNQMTQSICTTSTSVTTGFMESPGANTVFLREARQHVPQSPRIYPASNV